MTTKTIRILVSNRVAAIAITRRITLSDTPKAAASGVGLPSHVLFRRVGRHPAQVLHRHWPACWPAKLHNRHVVFYAAGWACQRVSLLLLCLVVGASWNFLKIHDLLDFYEELY